MPIPGDPVDVRTRVSYFVWLRLKKQADHRGISMFKMINVVLSDWAYRK